MEITAAVARAPRTPFSFERVALDEPRADEVLVRIAGVGLCHTDLVFRDQFNPYPLPAVLGHEGSGIVEKIGSAVTNVAPGDQVVLSFAHCGHCHSCNAARPALCRDFIDLNFSGMRRDGSSTMRCDGEAMAGSFFGQSSFATHALAYERNVVKVDTETPIELLGPLGCGIQTGAGAVLIALDCKPGSSLLVMGGGPVGLAAVMAAAARGVGTIILSEPVSARRSLAIELGATHVIDPGADRDVAAALRIILPEGVDVVLETSGLPLVLNQGLGCLAAGGVLGFVGVPPKTEDSISVNIANAITYGLTVKGIIEGDSDPQIFIPEMIRMKDEGRFPFDRLIKTYPLSAINEAIAAQHCGECVKAVLIP